MDPDDPEQPGDSIEQVDAHEAHRRVRAGALLVDLREPAERAAGAPADAHAVPMAQIGQAALPRDRPLVLLCAAGVRSQRAATHLQAAGYSQLCSVRGGFAAWREAGLPLGTADAADPDFSERYLRHLLLPEIGSEGQRRLEASSVLLVGAGGLGSPAALYLAAAGVGTLGIVDDDRIERSNLQRQVLHTEDAIGQPKVASAARAIGALNPRVHVRTHEERLHAGNVEALLGAHDVILDGSDNLPTRYLLSDACVRMARPLVYGAVMRFQGQVSVFDAGRMRGEAPCYRCLFPEPPSPDDAPDCAQAGVLGAVPGLIGLLQATETIKLLLGLGTPLTGRLLQVDVLSMRFRETRLRADPDCAVCAPGRAFPGYIDYQRFCAA